LRMRKTKVACQYSFSFLPDRPLAVMPCMFHSIFPTPYVVRENLRHAAKSASTTRARQEG
jgi:hypothetical protein